MRVCRRYVHRGGWSVVGATGALLAWACGGVHRESDIPVLEMELDPSGFDPGFSAEDSAVVQRLEDGEGPIRVRMVMCDEVLVDEVVSDRDAFSEVMQRALLDEFEWSEEALAELEALDGDSVAAAWAEQWEAMTPAQRDSFNTEMERIMPLVADFMAALDDTAGPDREALEALNQEVRSVIGPEALAAARQAACDEWRKVRSEFRKKGP